MTHPFWHPGVTGRPVQRCAAFAAWACLVVVLPSILWRLLMMAGVDMGFANAGMFRDSGTGTAYVFALEAAELAGGILCVGLARPWGEIWPRWMPGIGGRTIHRLLPTTLGTLAVVALLSMLVPLLARFVGTWFFGADNWVPDAGMNNWQRAVLLAMYLPLFTWPAFLTVALAGYWRRRSPAPARTTRETEAGQP